MDPVFAFLLKEKIEHQNSVIILTKSKKEIFYDAEEDLCGSIRVHIETGLIDDKIQFHLDQISAIEYEIQEYQNNKWDYNQEQNKENIPEKNKLFF